MDGRKNNGGKRPGAGRPPKADEVELISRLSPMDNEAFAQLQLGVASGDFQFIKLFLEYRFGKPKQQGDTPPINPVGGMSDEQFQQLLDAARNVKNDSSK